MDASKEKESNLRGNSGQKLEKEYSNDETEPDRSQEKKLGERWGSPRKDKTRSSSTKGAMGCARNKKFNGIMNT